MSLEVSKLLVMGYATTLTGPYITNLPNASQQGPVHYVLHKIAWAEYHRTGGDTALYLIQASGHLNWRIGLPALLGGNLGCWLV